MTISSETRKAGPFVGSGTTGPFPFAFKVFVASDLLCVKINTATNVESTLILTTDYTVNLNADQNANPGGSITLTSAMSSSFQLVIASQVEYLQETDLQNQGGFYPEVITDALDKLTILLQQIRLTSVAALFFPITDPAGISGQLPSVSVRANKVLTFDNTGAPDASIAAVDVQTVAGIASEISTVSANIGAVTTNSTNIAAINSAATNIAAIIAAPAAAAAASASAGAASTSATNASNSAAAAAAALASANLPPTLVGHAKEFLQVKADQTGYEFVSSVAAPAFYGFTLDATKTVLTLTYGRDDYDVADFLTWTSSENITFQVANNQLKQVFL
jgi:hypothetical protein